MSAFKDAKKLGGRPNLQTLELASERATQIAQVAN